MKFLLTGGNGYIGTHLAKNLLDHGHEVNALIYYGTDPSALRQYGASVYEGDIRDYRSVERAAKGCEAAYHLASYVGIWAHDPGVFEDINVHGTITLLNVCRNLGIKRVVMSSSCGIFGPSGNGELIDETHEVNGRSGDAYERSKFKQVEVAENYLDDGVEVLFVYPTRVFGPGIKSDGNSLTKIFEGVLDGSWKIMLGSGRNVGNYVYVEDVVRGMTLVMDKGESGEGYILGGYNFNYNFLFEMLQFLSGRQVRLRTVPAFLLRVVGLVCEFISSWTNRKPFITYRAAVKYTSDWNVSIEKVKQLGYRPTPVTEAFRRTIAAIEVNTASTESTALRPTASLG